MNQPNQQQMEQQFQAQLVAVKSKAYDAISSLNDEKEMLKARLSGWEQVISQMAQMMGTEPEAQAMIDKLAELLTPPSEEAPN